MRSLLCQKIIWADMTANILGCKVSWQHMVRSQITEDKHIYIHKCEALPFGDLHFHQQSRSFR